MEDAFSSYHPAVNFIFFCGAVLCGMFFSHPAFLAVSVSLSACYYLLLRGTDGLPMVFGMIGFILVIGFLNGVLNAEGSTVLFLWASGRQFTLESLLYGFAAGGMFATVIFWFACSSRIMTADRFTFLFGRLSPAVSLVLCMVLRFLPHFRKQERAIADARRCIGMSSDDGTRRERMHNSMTILSVMTSWALESSQATAESMQSRGYGSGKRTHFSIWRFRARDRAVLIIMAVCLAGLFFCAALGGMNMSWIPSIRFPGCRNAEIAGLVFYLLFLGIPTAIDAGEKIRWHSLRSKI